MEKFFKLSQHNTTVATEIIAGFTTFFAMSYILFVNPAILSLTGMPSQAVFLSTIIASAISTLIMGLFANVPYALAPGMGLNAFFTFTVVFSLGFSWQQALAMVFLCGMFNILITVTKIRKLMIKSIPESLQHAIGAGIGVFVAYIGVKNANFLAFLSDSGSILSVNNAPYQATATVNGVQSVVSGGGIVPELVKFTNPTSLLALFGLIFTIILMVKQVRGAILVSIITTTIIGILTGIVTVGHIDFAAGIGTAFSELGTTFGAAFGSEGLLSLFSDTSKLPTVLLTIFAFSLSDVFDTIGTFIGTGRRTGIFSEEDERALENSSGFSSKMDKALFADAIGTSIGAVFGTSNTTTYVESAAGIGAGGRTGLTSVVTALLFVVSTLAAPLVSIVPAAATAPALIIVGILMMSSFADINWTNFEEAVPAFFASVFMGFAYSISYGIAAGFIFYVIVKCVSGKIKEIHPIVWLSTALFIANFIILALIA
ncbi:NCS2 family permease [Granulicatella sp. zg-ZJ]|uniref:NCS2 family permease n=1 Tax=unclassified Granulicatella TaxID=2630493 RepID=UPI0013BFBC41|nr:MULTISPECIES: NCS2 family permease [unclassified Granulicatella]MBS4749907.1 NCS2 family permease [Carnobacteriaceae bacterium zg-ZUI78]NEW62095.1 NCS2 family permease [Granulicatella sp. zg-ZJ]NEW66398.1 NCS2 family permease [Granulicatella sp. zg-84]QMI86136.1 NCS2 family permease [Carnobacteriaceae bacterium zg-84]